MSRTATVTLTKPARRALGRQRTVVLALTVRAKDAAGNTSGTSATFK